MSLQMVLLEREIAAMLTSNGLWFSMFLFLPKLRNDFLVGVPFILGEYVSIPSIPVAVWEDI